MVQGKPLFAFDPLNMLLTDITFDFDYASTGWVAEIECNYPEAQLTGEIFLKNHTVYSGKKKEVPMLNGYISYTGPGNLTLEDSYFSTKSPLENDRSTIRLKGIKTCAPPFDEHT